MMSMMMPGETVVNLMRSASDDVLIAAPYIKSHALRRIIEILPNRVSQFRCVTRWLPKDIASGVCDIEIYDDVSNLTSGTLLVHPYLHAKYYRTANRCLIGSANVTGSGLGWSARPNFELLFELPADSPGMSEWENSLLSSSIEVTEELRDRLRKQADSLKEDNLVPDISGFESSEEIRMSPWIPSCPAPERLWEVYQGPEPVYNMISSTLETAQDDLEILALPGGLSRGYFNSYITRALRQMPFMIEIDKLTSTGLTETQAHSFISQIITSDSANDYSEREYSSEVQNRWRIVKSWIQHFFPEQYRLEPAQEILVKGGALRLR